MENKKAYIAKWQRGNTKIIPVRLNLNKDNDILKKLEIVPSKGGYIKSLIREDIMFKKISKMEQGNEK